jgi:hypothetical protein
MMPRAIEVRALPQYRLWLRYDDGVEGEVDLSTLAGHGVFKAWEQKGLFESVRIAPYGAIIWGESLDLCADALYLKLTGRSPDDVFAAPVTAEADA